MCDATVWQPCAPELTLPLIPKLLSGTALLPPQAFQKTNPLHPQAEDTQKCTCTHTTQPYDLITSSASWTYK